MMRKLTMGLGIAAVFVLFLTSGYAYKSGRYNEDVTDEVENDVWLAIEEQDFEAWKDAMNERITYEYFADMVNHHILFEDRDLRRDMHQAVISNDYDEWHELANDAGMIGDLSEEDFAIMKDMRYMRHAHFQK